MSEPLQLCDAHNHLQDERLRAAGFEADPWIQRQSDYQCVVNGTEETDWDAVAHLARHPGVHPAYGLHPWKLQPSPGWEERLRQRLLADPGAGVGETGLDRNKGIADFDEQVAIFSTHLKLAAELDRPLTVHCLNAWGALVETLRGESLPARGFLLHAYAGSVEMVDQLVELGAYFSFSPAFADPKRKRALEAFSRIPPDRLLVETDAPSMPPPAEMNSYVLSAPVSVHPVNHPANLIVALEALAHLRKLSTTTLAKTVQENFLRWLGKKSKSFAENR